ncbi:hypothetical protein MGYG_08085 [Nannizzia gypsea CBS 118893]|uniref:Uncharacterized protein n=1 Tax=Arthroderma gypseum (strain ATCC MYA-4604 / CBS 118893) TaxID=535722 RepID=E4V502_ARTGP|nr:hypothetical protein MGYG_08085 [Nannizzia gypsea CBS 118893]EFR05076.1 hypothetical protein MGYG_08085 [Nannizzia gypsea CBS 118893]
MDVRRVANGLVSKQTSLLVRQHFSRPACTSQPLCQSIRTISTSQPLSDRQKDAPVASQQQQRQQKTPSPSQNNFDVDSISNLLDDVYDRVGSSNSPSSSNVTAGFRNLFQNADVGRVTRAVRDSVANNTNEGGRAVPRYPELKLTPKLGRTIAVDPSRGIDVTGAFSMMEAQVARNKIKADERAQRHHLRKGRKRKAAKSKLWRALFKKSFQVQVARCMELKRQGW